MSSEPARLETPNEETHPITPNPGITGYVPAVERSEHRAMYLFYAGLGKDRTLAKVGKHFGKSMAFISNLSRAFNWLARIKTQEMELSDPVVVETKDKVDASRKKLVDVVYEIADTLHELTGISKKIKAGEVKVDSGGVVTGVHVDRLNILHTSLKVFGFQVDSAKGVRDLISILREVVKFNVDTGQATEAGAKRTPDVRIDKVQLLIKD